MTYTCRTLGCSGTYKSRAELLQHQKNHGTRFGCPFKAIDCSFTSCDKDVMANHVSVTHSNLVATKCPDSKCAFMSAYSVSVRRHAQTQHGHSYDPKPRKPRTEKSTSFRGAQTPGDMRQPSHRNLAPVEEIYQGLTGDGPGYDTFLNPNATHFPDPVLYPGPPMPGSTMPYMASPFYDYTPSGPSMCDKWENPLHVAAPVNVERRVSQPMYY